jgi:two-component system chemotaxis response regulator CheB
LRTLFAALPKDYPAAVFVVVHLAPEAPSILPDILNRTSNMPVMLARFGAKVRRSTIMIAPPNLHLVLEGDEVLVTHGPRENRHRPAIDVLFRSAAVTYGPRVTGVVLSGMQDDGAAGLWAIKRRGGAAIVQDPDDAEFPDMPRNAMETVVDVDACVPVSDMAPTLMRLVHAAVQARDEPAPPNMQKEVRMAAKSDSSMEELDAIGTRVPFTCPECGGSLWELENGGPRFRCHNGHAYSLNTLADEQSVQVEAALWAALRRLEESERLANKMAAQARLRGNERSAEYHAEMASTNATHAATLRQLLTEKTTSAQAKTAGG